MLCCCARDPAKSYSVEESGKSSQAQEIEATPIKSAEQPQQKAPNAGGDTKIITGKGALSTSNQNLAVAGEANLDKSTISATKREKSPITQQPISNQTRETTSDQPQEKEVGPKEIAESVTSGQPKSVSVISVTKPEPPSELSGSIEKAIESSASPKALEACPNLPLGEGNLESINSSLDKVEKELSEAESKKSWEAGALVPGLAAQVKVLTSQVLAQTATSGMGDQGLGAAVSRLEAVATRLEALAGGKSSVGAGDSGRPLSLIFHTHHK